MQKNNEFDTENMLVSVKNQLKEGLELNSDYNLPDYIEDIRKLVRYDSDVTLHNIFNNGNSLQCEGEVIYNILVICEDDSIKNIIYSDEFTLSMQAKQETDEEDIYCALSSPSVRLTTQRKLNCRSRVNIYSRIKEKMSLSPKISGECNAVERKSEIVDTVCEETFHELNNHASHDIELSSNTPEISNIVYCRVNTHINEIKYIEGRLALRGETWVRILYESEDKEYHFVDRALPYSEFIDSEYDENTPCLCKVKIKDIKVTVQNNSFGEMRILELDYSYDIEEKFFVKHRSEVTRDAFCIGCASEIKTECFDYKVQKDHFSDIINLRESKEIPDFNDYLPLSVTDTFTDIRSSEISYDKENRKLVLSCECDLRVIAKTENGYYNFGYTLPVRYEREAECIPEHPLCEHTLDITALSCNIEDSRLTVSMTLCLNCFTAEILTAGTVTEIEAKPTDEKRSSSLTLYYPKEGEELWDIAKRYTCRCSEIINVNSLKNDDIKEARVLLIPSK